MPENPEPTAVRVPKYYLVKKEILALIAGLAPGTPVPTERELAARFATSRTTVRQAIADAEADLAKNGRLLIRPSGTEPLIRVMAEGDDRGQVERIVDELIGVIGSVRNAA